MKQWVGLMFAGGVLFFASGCLVIQTCDPDKDAACEDENRGQIKGHVSVAGAKMALQTENPINSERLREARRVLNQVYSSYWATQKTCCSCA